MSGTTNVHSDAKAYWVEGNDFVACCSISDGYVSEAPPIIGEVKGMLAGYFFDYAASRDWKVTSCGKSEWRSLSEWFRLPSTSIDVSDDTPIPAEQVVMNDRTREVI